MMEDYVLVLRQKPACDHSIGCGVRIIEFSAETYHDASVKAANIIVGTGDGDGYHDEYKIESAEIYFSSGKFSLDVDSIYTSYYALCADENEMEREKREMELFLKLKKKYGDK
jgi:hypothetical protein